MPSKSDEETNYFCLFRVLIMLIDSIKILYKLGIVELHIRYRKQVRYHNIVVSSDVLIKFCSISLFSSLHLHIHEVMLERIVGKFIDSIALFFKEVGVEFHSVSWLDIVSVGCVDQE